MWVPGGDSATHRHQPHVRRWPMDELHGVFESPPSKSSIWGHMMILRSSGRVSRLGALLLACSALAAIPASAQVAGEPKVVRFGTWGVDLGTRDMSVKPGDDFARYAAGKWMDETEIPADKSQNGVGSELADRNQEQLRAIVTTAPRDSQIGALYASYMDEPRLEQLDADPLKADLARVDAIGSKAELTRFKAATLADDGSTLFAVGVLPDPNNPAVNTAFVGTSGLGLPDRDYYLLDKHNKERDAYRAYIERTLSLIGSANASAEADTIIAFETEIAKLSVDKTDLRDIDKLNKPI